MLNTYIYLSSMLNNLSKWRRREIKYFSLAIILQMDFPRIEVCVNLDLRYITLLTGQK
jgi:hypothetical protein